MTNDLTLCPDVYRLCNTLEDTFGRAPTPNEVWAVWTSIRKDATQADVEHEARERNHIRSGYHVVPA